VNCRNDNGATPIALGIGCPEIVGTLHRPPTQSSSSNVFVEFLSLREQQVTEHTDTPSTSREQLARASPLRFAHLDAERLSESPNSRTRECVVEGDCSPNKRRHILNELHMNRLEMSLQTAVTNVRLFSIHI
jgi:hypothetical protein